MGLGVALGSPKPDPRRVGVTKDLMAVGVMLAVGVIVGAPVGVEVWVGRGVGVSEGRTGVGVEYVPHKDGVAISHANWKMARMEMTVSRRFTGGNYTRLDKGCMRTTS